MFPIAQAPQALAALMDGKAIFDFYRLVDVARYEVCDMRCGALDDVGERCFDVWRRGKACDNCISRVATEEMRQTVKMESVDGQIFLIVSQPVCVCGRTLALELIKNVTENLLVNDQDLAGNVRLESYIAKINELTVHDSFTGLFNRRFAQDELGRAVQDFQEGDALTAVLLDVDWFKEVNDTYGHLKGDEVLLTVAEILETYAKRGAGWASRVGGDEFLVVMKKDAQEAGKLARELCEAVENRTFVSEKGTFHVTLSAGLATFEPCMKDWRALYEAADRKMYRQKKARHARPHDDNGRAR